MSSLPRDVTRTPVMPPKPCDVIAVPCGTTYDVIPAPSHHVGTYDVTGPPSDITGAPMTSPTTAVTSPHTCDITCDIIISDIITNTCDITGRL
ncbi:hypothetical protein WISP_00349 [Willisornis vidua]|uniref:Uncharacterized protein n=1 Tax=Willisornis vidua TaxID=1566151 RepID=A0ABQ9DWD7_9PASS|nr:hypothetical protein WISP_00349 [Willisornis vidua]